MMFTSLRSRLWLSYALLIATALSVVAMILFVYLFRNPISYRQTLDRLRAVQVVLNNRKELPLQTTAEEVSRTFDVRILQYSRDKQVLLDTYSATEPTLPFPEKKLLTRNVPLAKDEKGIVWLYTAEKLEDKTILVIAAPRPRVSILNFFADDLLPIILQSGLIALLLSLFVAFIFARWIGDPLQMLVAAARGMPSNEPSPVEIRGPQEVQELTRAFNAMVARVQSSQSSQREFVANVSHELKTPLTSIQGFSQAILDGTVDSPDEINEAAQVIYDESARMHRMVLDLLDLARLDSGTADITLSPVDLSALLHTIVEKFRPQSQKSGVEIELDVPLDLPPVIADGDRLSQVFTNLVDNALKFTPSGGMVKLHAWPEKEGVLISVTDTGAGIPSEAEAHIFDRFFQADSARKGGEKHGAGLGLAIVREIVHAHGGRISLRSRLGEGTTFEVFLPLSKK